VLAERLNRGSRTVPGLLVGWHDGKFGVWQRSGTGLQLLYLICEAEKRSFHAFKRFVEERQMGENVHLSDPFLAVKEDRSREVGFGRFPKNQVLDLLSKRPRIFRHRRSIRP
jgi:hypothetical protein